MLDGLQSLCTDYNIALAASLSSGTSDHIPCRLMNPTSTKIFLPQDLEVATITPLLPTCIVSTIGPKSATPSVTTQDPIVFNIDDNNLTPPQREALVDTLNSYRNVFAKDNSELGCTSAIRHHINVNGSKPIKSTPYRTNIETRQKLKEHIDEMLDLDIIQESNSPWAAPIILVTKKDGSTRFCCDFRKLNAVTVKDSYPLPRIDDTLDSLSGSSYFSTLDMLSGFWQLEVDKESRPLTAFTSYEGLYEFKRLPFGLCNAPSTFQRLMELVLRGMQWHTCLIYMDDVIVYSKTFDEHIQRLAHISSRLRDSNLTLKPSKCRFLHLTIDFLGHVISPEGVRPNPSKVDLINSFPPPITAKQIKQFLGLAGYYHRFIPNFAHLAAPLTKLLRKNVKFSWSPECQTAFTELQHCLTTPPVLAFPDFTSPYHLYTMQAGTLWG